MNNGFPVNGKQGMALAPYEFLSALAHARTVKIACWAVPNLAQKLRVLLVFVNPALPLATRPADAENHKELNAAEATKTVQPAAFNIIKNSAFYLR